MIYGIILVKLASIYDKLKQIVAINSVRQQLVESQRKSMNSMFASEEMIQDLITRKVLEENKLIEDEDVFLASIKFKPEFERTKII